MAASLGLAQGHRAGRHGSSGDGLPEVIAATGPGGEARVCVYDGATLRPGVAPALVAGPLADFAPYPGFAGGLFVAAGDLRARDGRADLVVAPDALALPATPRRAHLD